MIDRDALLAWYRRNRDRSRDLFDMISENAYYSKPIELRHPPVFYEGHLPGFSFNTLVKKGLGRPSIDARLEALFARGIDPHESRATVVRDARMSWPSRDDVRQFAAEADRQVIDALEHAEIERPRHPLLDRAEAAFAILEHEAMHQETLLYIWHRLPYSEKKPAAGYVPAADGDVAASGRIEVPAGRATLGVNAGERPFSWDNERPAVSEHVATFTIDQHNVTNAAFLEFVEAGGYSDARWWTAQDWAWVNSQGWSHPLFWERDGDRWLWRGMFDRLPLPLSWPVYVSHAEASAYACWRRRRLPTEAEFQRAAYGTPSGEERPFPWGDEPPDATRGVFDFASWDPRPAGSSPEGRSAWGVHDLTGNGWEWTRTPFAPFSGFTPLPSYPEYSAEFFDNEHFVMKGASPATARELLRPTFRNWFRPRYPYVYATFRCVSDAPG